MISTKKIKKLLESKIKDDKLLGIELVISEITGRYHKHYCFQYLNIKSYDFKIFLNLPSANNEWTNLAFEIFKFIHDILNLTYIDWGGSLVGKEEKKMCINFKNYMYI